MHKSLLRSASAASPIRSTIRSLQPNGIALVAGVALGEPDVIALWFGESDLPTPDFIRDAAKAALDEGRTFYTNARGIAPLRTAIQDFHRRTCGADIVLERITVPGSAMLSVIIALQCLIETGDNIVCVAPVWPNIFQAAEICGAEVKFATLVDDWSAARPNWRLDLQSLVDACDARTRAIFLSSPGNPTGWIMSREEQLTVLGFARERGIAIISDEVYGTIVYDGRAHAPSFLEIAEPDDAVFVINSFSKPWAMTGWRIGWLVHPAQLDAQMWMMSAANNTGATTFAQYGAVAALSPRGEAFRADMLRRFRTGRDTVKAWIGEQNRIRWIEPDGAFYGFLHVDGLRNSLEFGQNLARTSRVGVSPGSAFGPAGDAHLDSFIRICFAPDAALVREGLDRLAKALAEK